MAEVWVSELALITRTRGGNIEGFVLEANSGEPVRGAEISVWHLDNNSGNRVADPNLATDTNGFFSMKPEPNRAYLFRARHHGRELATAQDTWWYQWNQREEPRPYAQTVLFHRPCDLSARANDSIQRNMWLGLIRRQGQLRNAQRRASDRRVPRRERQGNGPAKPAGQ